MQGAIAALQARGDLFTRQLINEKQRAAQHQAKLNDINEKIQAIQTSNKKAAITLLNKHMTTANDAYRRADGLDPIGLAKDNQRKLVRKLEGRLNKTLMRQNGIENENNAIRGKIEKLRRKIHNDNLNRASMGRELRHIQDQMDNIMRRAAMATEQREKIIERRNQLIRENLDKREKFQTEYQRLCTLISDQAKMLEDSIAAVANDVISKSNTTEAGQGSGEAGQGGIDPIEELKALDEKIASLDGQYESNKQVLQHTEEKIRTYEDNFRQLREVSGLTSIDDITSAFVKNEEESFSIFNYIQAVNQDCDFILEQRSSLEQEMKAISKEQKDQENQRVSIMNEHKEKLREAKEEREKMAEVAREEKATVLQIAKKVQALYLKLRCRQLDETDGPQHANGGGAGASHARRPPASDRKLTMFEGEKEISERNILRHMELIEKRSIQIIGVYAKRLIASARHGNRRPSLILSPKTFEQAGLAAGDRHGYVEDDVDGETFGLSDSDGDGDDSDGDGSDKPVSVYDMRRQAAEKLRPQSAGSHRRVAMTRSMRNIPTDVPARVDELPKHPKRKTII